MRANELNSTKLNGLVDHLILYCESIDSVGLYYGKAGISLALFAYAHSNHLRIYQDLAMELLQECLDSLSLKTEGSFGTGISGIGWLILYLYKRGVITDSVEDILMELDNQIMTFDVFRSKDKSFDDGLRGIAFYVWYRCNNSSIRNAFDEVYIDGWTKLLQELCSTADVQDLPSIWSSFINRDLFLERQMNQLQFHLFRI